MKHEYTSSDDWYDALKAIAAKHDNTRAVRDREGWTDNWRNQTPEFAYYDEFPEHKQGA
jgi:hypothetical protein